MPLNIWNFFKNLIVSYNNDKVSSLSAALSYYMIFAIAPILLICIALAGLALGTDAAHGRILAQISGLVGHDSALQIQAMVENLNKPKTALMARLIGVAVLFFATSGIFSEIQTGLNTIWGVKSSPERSWMSLIKNRFLSFTMVLAVALLLLMSLLLSAVFTAILPYISYISHYFGVDMYVKLMFSEVLLFIVVTLMFALLFKALPDVQIKWREVATGALITGVMFTLGKVLLGVYFRRVPVASAYGAAGTLIVVLIWVYYSAQIFFIGAEITKVLATRHGKKVQLKRDAVFQ